MASKERQLRVIIERCIGCRACSTMCPENLITLIDSDHRRTLRFAVFCAEDCDRCEDACPTQAICLEREAAGAREPTILTFALTPCEGCGAPLAPAEMLAHLQSAIPAQVQADSEGQGWLALCQVCRKQVEARRMAHETLMTRWPA